MPATSRLFRGTRENIKFEKQSTPHKQESRNRPAGIRLNGDGMILVTKRRGVENDRLARGLVNKPIEIEITQVNSRVKPFFRFRYQCPNGVYVESIIGSYSGMPNASEVNHKSLHPERKEVHVDNILRRSPGQKILIRIRDGVSPEDAADDLFNNGIHIALKEVVSETCNLLVQMSDMWQIDGESADVRAPISHAEDPEQRLAMLFMTIAKQQLPTEVFHQLLQLADGAMKEDMGDV